ncbi:MAG: hypothetical protein ACYC9O_09250 [Candidatus Latescibacterota bacterium]
MVKREHILLALIATALTVLTAGCYTVVDTAAGRGPATVERERIVYVEREPAQTGGGSAQELEGEEYVEEEEDGEEYQSVEDPDARPGLNQDKYLRKYTEYEDSDGKTIIKNYYYDDEPGWYSSWYSRYGYDPWYWDTCIRPYRFRPYIHIGYAYDPFIWDSWYWNVGWSGGWYDPWHWHEPWYWQPGWAYAYNPWYYHGYDHWYYGGGGSGGGSNGGGGDVVSGPRKIRPDRLAGFGSGRGNGGIVSTGGLTTEKTTPGEAVNGRTVRRDNRDGFGTENSRRRSPVEVTSGTTEKPAGETAGTVTTSGRRRNTENAETPTHQRVRSGETTRRVRSDNEATTLETISRRARTQNDEQVGGTAREETRVERQTPGSRTGEEAVRKTTNDTSGQRRPQARVWIRRDSNVSRSRDNSEAQTRRSDSEETTSREVTRRSASPQQSDSGNRTSDNSSERTVQRRSSDNAQGESVSRPSSSSSGRSSSSTPSVSRSTPSSGRSSGVSSGGSSGRSSGGSSGRSSGGNSRPSTSQSGSRRR